MNKLDLSFAEMQEQLQPFKNVYRLTEATFEDSIISGKLRAQVEGYANPQPLSAVSRGTEAVEETRPLGTKLSQAAAPLRAVGRAAEVSGETFVKVIADPMEIEKSLVAKAASKIIKKLEKKIADTSNAKKKSRFRLLRDIVRGLEIAIPIVSKPLLLGAATWASTTATQLVTQYLPGVDSLNLVCTCAALFTAANAILKLRKVVKPYALQQTAETAQNVLNALGGPGVETDTIPNESEIREAARKFLRREMMQQFSNLDSAAKTFLGKNGELEIRRFLARLLKFESFTSNPVCQNVPDELLYSFLFQGLKDWLRSKTDITDASAQLEPAKDGFSAVFKKAEEYLEKRIRTAQNLGPNITLENRSVREKILSIIEADVLQQASSQFDCVYETARETFRSGEERVGIVNLDKTAKYHSDANLVGKQWFKKIENLGLLTGGAPYVLVTNFQDRQAILDAEGRNLSGWQANIRQFPEDAHIFLDALVPSDQKESFFIISQKEPYDPPKISLVSAPSISKSLTSTCFDCTEDVAKQYDALQSQSSQPISWKTILLHLRLTKNFDDAFTVLYQALRTDLSLKLDLAAPTAEIQRQYILEKNNENLRKEQVRLFGAPNVSSPEQLSRKTLAKFAKPLEHEDLERSLLATKRCFLQLLNSDATPEFIEMHVLQLAALASPDFVATNPQTAADFQVPETQAVRLQLCKAYCAAFTERYFHPGKTRTSLNKEIEQLNKILQNILKDTPSIGLFDETVRRMQLRCEQDCKRNEVLPEVVVTALRRNHQLLSSRFLESAVGADFFRQMSGNVLTKVPTAFWSAFRADIEFHQLSETIVDNLMRQPNFSHLETVLELSGKSMENLSDAGLERLYHQADEKASRIEAFFETAASAGESREAIQKLQNRIQEARKNRREQSQAHTLSTLQAVRDSAQKKNLSSRLRGALL